MKEQINTPTRTTTQTNSAVCELEQINEMANDIAKICPDLVENSCGQINCVTHLTLSLYKEDYRKQIVGNWIFNRGRCYGEPAYYCSNCSEGASEYGLDNFCPNCGAKMKGE